MDPYDILILLCRTCGSTVQSLELLSSCSLCWDANFRCYEGRYELDRFIAYGGDMSWRSSLRHCSTSRKVAASIPDGVTGIFRRHNPSGRIMALGSTQPLTEMSTRNISLA
jgi:hypothetical protein